MAIKKNRKENGSRDEEDGSNPHSNGEAFSRSITVFLERRDPNIIVIPAIIKITIPINLITNIIYTIIK